MPNPWVWHILRVMQKLSIPALAEMVPDEEAAYILLEGWRWGDRPVCPHCGSVRTPYFLTPKATEGRGRSGSGSAAQLSATRGRLKSLEFVEVTGVEPVGHTVQGKSRRPATPTEGA